MGASPPTATEIDAATRRSRGVCVTRLFPHSTHREMRHDHTTPCLDACAQRRGQVLIIANFSDERLAFFCLLFPSCILVVRGAHRHTTMSALRRFVRSRAVADNDRRLEECLANTRPSLPMPSLPWSLVLRKPPQLPQQPRTAPGAAGRDAAVVDDDMARRRQRSRNMVARACSRAVQELGEQLKHDTQGPHAVKLVLDRVSKWGSAARAAQFFVRIFCGYVSSPPSRTAAAAPMRISPGPFRRAHDDGETPTAAAGPR